MSRVFITGIAGFLGSHLADALLAQGHDVHGVDNLIGGDKENIVGLKSFHWHIDDCAEFETMKFLIKGADVVYHCACTPHEGLSVFSPCTVARSVFDGTVAVATAAVVNKVKRLVFLSSMSRYGIDIPPFIESNLVFPVDPYGIAKVASEKMCFCLGKAHGMEVVVGVPHNIIGSRQKYDDPYRNVASIFINRILQGKPPVIYGTGTQQRVFSHVSDVIEPLVKLGFQAGLDGEIVNLGPDDNPVSINELAETILHLMGRDDLRPIYVPDRPCEVKEAWPSADKARRLLGYKPMVSLEVALVKMIEWITRKGAKDFVYHLPLEIISEKTPKTWKERIF